MMPTITHISPSWQRSAGITITWIPTAQRLDISGFHSSVVGIAGESMTLRDFFDRLDITEAHCRKAFREEKEVTP